LGATVDPLSLHKYNYAGCNPTNCLDPSGLDWFFANLGRAVHRAIGTMYVSERPMGVRLGRSIPGLAGALMPDIMDFTLKEIAEIKPLSKYGLAAGPIELYTYVYVANALNVAGAVPRPWGPSRWAVGIRQVPVPEYPNYFVVTLGNAYGLIFYKAFKVPKGEFKLALTAAFVALLAKYLESTVQMLKSTAKQGIGTLEGVVAALDYQTEQAFTVAMAQRTAQFAIPMMTAALIASFMMRVNLSLATKGLY